MLFAGARNDVVVHVVADEPIPRAQQLSVRFDSIAVSTFNGSDAMNVSKRVLASLFFETPLRGLGQGAHPIPLVLDLPSWVPPSLSFGGSEIVHLVHFELDVDWALDVEGSQRVRVASAPWQGAVAATPLAMRTGPELGGDVAFDVTLASATVAEGDALRGTIAIRSGHRASYPDVHLAVVQTAEVLFTPPSSWPRIDRSIVSELSIPFDALRAGHAIEFRIPIDRQIAIQRNGIMNLSCRFEIALPRMQRMQSIPLSVAPRGTVISGGSAPSLAPVGLPRMEAITEAVVKHSGLPRASWPTLAHGREGMVDVVVADESRGAHIFAVEHHRFPRLRLGLGSRPQGLPSSATLAPPLLASVWVVEASPAAARLGDVLRDLVAKLLIGNGATHLELSDDHLTMWHRLHQDDVAEWVTVAMGARARARSIDGAIRALPFADESFREGWTRAAADESAILLQHLPGLALVRRTARTLGGEERNMVCAISGRLEANETRVTVAFDAPVPDEALLGLARDVRDHPLTSQLRPTYGTFRVDSAQQVTATASGVLADPRPLLDTLSVFLDWQMRARGEHPVVAPYR